MRWRTRRLGVMRTAAVLTIANTLLFAVILLPFALIFLIIGLAAGGDVAPVAVGFVVFAVFMLLSAAVFTWLFTALQLVFVNLAARWLGGLEVDAEVDYGGGYPPYWYGGAGYPTSPAAQAPPAPPAAAAPHERR